MSAALIALLLIAMPAAAAERPASTITAARDSSPVFSTEEPAGESAGEDAARIPVVMNESVDAYVRFFRTRGRNIYQRWLDDSAHYLPMMREAFRKERVPVDLLFVAMIESGFDSGAVSRTRAVGQWQFMPDTAKLYGLKSDWWIDERKDLVKSTRAAARHFRNLYELFGSWPLALAAYNGGVGTVKRAVLKAGTNDFWRLKRTRFLPRETKNFVPKFMAAVLIGRNPARYGFRVPDAVPLRYDEIVVGGGTDLNFIAYLTGSTYERIKALNPEIRGVMTPPDRRNYIVKIPPGRKKTYLARSAALWKTVEGVSWEELARLSVFGGIGVGRVFRAGAENCPRAVRPADFAQDTPQTAVYRNVAWSASRPTPGMAGKRGGGNFLLFCER